MGKADAITRKYMKNPMIFADAFNQYLYHGNQKIDPAQLTELDTAEIVVPYGADGASVPEQEYRDVLNLLCAMTDGKTILRHGNREPDRNPLCASGEEWHL